MTQTGKVVALISSFGAVGGVGAYAGGLFESKKDETKEIKSTPLIATISDRLTDEGFLVLDTTNNKDWQEVFDAYNNDGTTKNLFSKQKEKFKEIKELQTKCSEIINKAKSTDDSYSLAKQWCVKKEKMQDILGRKNLKLLKFDEKEDQDEKSIWNEKIKKLRENPQKFSAVEIKEQEAENITAFKTACKDLKTDTLFTTSEEFEKNLELAKECCSTRVK